jgi:hypothetical protein
LFLLDGLSSSINENDIGRRNAIAKLLEEWGLLNILDQKKSEQIIAGLNQIKIIPFKDKQNWELIPKYHIGKKH